MPFAPINTNTMGPNVIVPAKSGMAIQVLSYKRVAAGAVTAQWNSVNTGTSTTTNLEGPCSLITGVPEVCVAGFVWAGGGRTELFETLPGDELVLTLGGGVQVSGHLEYVYKSY